MRLRLPIGRTVFVAAFFALSLVALLPLRLALGAFGFGELGISARAATGSIWTGALQEAQLGPVALGDVGARLNLLPLFLGRARLSLVGADQAAPIAGALVVTRHGFGFEDLTGRLRIGGPAASLPVAALDLQDVSAGFAGGRCVRAEGRVRASLGGDLAGAGIASALAGNARCADEALLLPLASGSGSEQLNLRLFADGRYRADLAVRSTDPAVRARLAAAGFRDSGGVLALRLDGSF